MKLPFKFFWPKRVTPSPNLIDENSSRHSDSVDSNSKQTNGDGVLSPSELKGDKNKPDKKEKKQHRKGGLCGLICLLLLLLIILLLLLLLILLLVFGLAPCRFKSCHKNATCINQSFTAKCVCNRGFNGNGIECDECGLRYPNTSLSINPSYYSQYNDRNIPAPFSYPATAWVNLRYNGLTNSTLGDGNELYYVINLDCNGLLVNRRTIITSASCIYSSYQAVIFSGLVDTQLNIDVSLDYYHPDWDSIFSAYLGLYHYFYSFNQVGPVKRVLIENIIVHDGYTNGSLNNDIAIIKLKKSVDLNRYIQLACIPDSQDHQNESMYLTYNASAVSIGWSYYMVNNNYGYYLTDFDLNILNNTNCSQFYSNTSNLAQTICAGNYFQLANSPYYYIGMNCQGAVGSALYINVTRNGVMKNLAIGLNINNTLCGLGVYTNLFDYADWISKYSNY